MIALVIDTETIDLNDYSMFDYGAVLYDLSNKKILEETQLFPEEVFNTPLYRKAYYYKKNKDFYDKLENKKVVPMIEVRKSFNEMIRKADYFSAFNAKFDLKALSFNFMRHAGSKNQLTYKRLSKNGLGVIDIPIMFAKLVNASNYMEYCLKYNHMTPKGNVRTTAEVVYKYITDNKEHEETHTALQDAREEAEILSYLFTLNEEDAITQARHSTVGRPYQIIKTKAR